MAKETGWCGGAQRGCHGDETGLQAVGIQRGDVTAAFLSHAHVDHIAGFVTDDAITFPNAQFFCTQEEVDFWFSPEPDFSKSKRNKAELPGLTRDNRKRFEILKPVTQVLKDGSSVWGGDIKLELAPGHTAGHAIFHIQSKREKLLHIMDLVHHHLLMFANVNWTIAFDHDPELAVVTRKKVYARVMQEKTRLYGFHLPWPGLGHQGSGRRILICGFRSDIRGGLEGAGFGMECGFFVRQWVP